MGKFGWMLANALITLLPLIVYGGMISVYQSLPPNARFDATLMITASYSALPLILIAGVALKTYLNMPRIFDFSPIFLFRTGNIVMVVALVIAVVSAFTVLTTWSTSGGWEYVMAPLIALAITIQSIATGGAILIIGLITRYLRHSSPSPPPPSNPSWLDDPLSSEMT